MLTRIKTSFLNFVDVVRFRPRELFSHNVVLFGSGIVAVSTVAIFGFTALTLWIALGLAISAGVGNAVFNTGLR